LQNYWKNKEIVKLLDFLPLTFIFSLLNSAT